LIASGAAENIRNNAGMTVWEGANYDESSEIDM